MSKLIRSNKDSTELLNIEIRKDMDYTGLRVITLKKGETISETVEDDLECCLVLVTGYGDLSINHDLFENIGNRMSVFVEQNAYAAYIKGGDTLTFKANTDVEIALTYGLGNQEFDSRLIEPSMDKVEHRGYNTMQRTAKNILSETEDAFSLLVVEVITKGGNWSSFPSHRHDELDLPNQSNLEEIYYHKVTPEEKGFAFQRVYNDDETLDEAYVLKNNSAVLVKEGYHPVSVPEGCDVYYLNVMAGPVRTWKFHNDPTFEHLLK